MCMRRHPGSLLEEISYGHTDLINISASRTCLGIADLRETFKIIEEAPVGYCIGRCTSTGQVEATSERQNVEELDAEGSKCRKEA